MTGHTFRIDPRLDPAGLHEEYRASGRLHIPGFLVAEDAEALLAFLKKAEAWKLVFNAGEKLFELDRATQAGLPEAKRRELEQAIQAKARYEFQFCYETIRVPDAERERLAAGTLLADFARFLSQGEGLAFLQAVTGEPAIAFADAQATAYGPGHFLTAHDDAVAGKHRKAAYVMNLTKDWSADWGGLLAFHQPGVAAAEALVPSFNAINLFSVPQPHSVTILAPFAPRRRYAVTGWLRGGTRP
ncbi:2OG-Fe(II) oxygenase [Erythrobacter sp. NE805]|uniref:2OG-Fe(II) oxygenase n=1 Tax=Erythrobacter sp. NE805 TaxID=3389875 RepID=UPI00396AFB9E